MIRTSLCALRLVPITSRSCDPPDLPRGSSYWLRPALSDRRLIFHFCVTPSRLDRLASRYRNINLISIAYAFRPRLRVRLTLSGLTFLRKP